MGCDCFVFSAVMAEVVESGFADLLMRRAVRAVGADGFNESSVLGKVRDGWRKWVGVSVKSVHLGSS